MKQVLITGATGLVGTHLIAELLEQTTTEERGVIAVAHSAKSWTKLDWLLTKRGTDNKPYRQEIAELEYIEDCRRLIHELRPSIIFHCAAQVALGKASEELVTRNVEITHNLLTAALELPKEEQPLFIHVSSIAALGRTANESGLIDESAIMENMAGASAYARSKFLSEGEVWRAAAHGLRMAMVNPSVVIGATSPGSGFWLNGLFRAARGSGIPFWIDGEVGFVSATDVAKAMILLSEEPKAWGERYILSAEDLPYRALLTHISQLVDKRIPWLKIPRWILKLASPFIPALTSVISPQRPLDGSKITRTIPLQYSNLRDTLTQIAAIAEKI